MAPSPLLASHNYIKEVRLSTPFAFYEAIMLGGGKTGNVVFKIQFGKSRKNPLNIKQVMEAI